MVQRKKDGDLGNRNMKKSVGKSVGERDGGTDSKKNLLEMSKGERSNKEKINHCHLIKEANEKKLIIANQYKFV